MKCFQPEEVTGEPAPFVTPLVLEVASSIKVVSLPALRQQSLFDVLKAYSLYRPDEGYCQAQAPITAVLLMHMPAEVNAHAGP